MYNIIVSKNRFQEIANETNSLLMSFIASDAIVKTSPSSYDYTLMTMDDLYCIEEKINEIKDLPDKLSLVIHTPGGMADAATKIAKYLQSKFKEVVAYVPYEASSGGTVLCLAANRIVMDEVSNLTPIDPQVPYKGIRISAVSYSQAISDYQKKWGNNMPNDIKSPYQQMGKEFDPIIEKQMYKYWADSMEVAFKLMNRSQNPKDDQKLRNKLLETAFDLVYCNTPHSHVIDKQEAEEKGLSISKDPKELGYLKELKEWVKKNRQEKSNRHIIEIYEPKKNIKKDEKQKDKTK